MLPLTQSTMNEDQSKYIYQLEIKVRDYELDAEGIVNNANYLHYLEVTRHEFCSSQGLSFGEMRQRGIDPVVSRIEIDYMVPLHADETMVSKLWLERRGPRFVFHQDIFHQDGSPVVKAIVTAVAIENGRPSRGDALAQLFAKFL